LNAGALAVKHSPPEKPALTQNAQIVTPPTNRNIADGAPEPVNLSPEQQTAFPPVRADNVSGAVARVTRTKKICAEMIIMTRTASFYK
jgi:hypothetical protein|tara:strand:+ start:1888 stop:2151 length:264 start_codon:yes stop_codon:yes gene_type:complete